MKSRILFIISLGLILGIVFFIDSEKQEEKEVKNQIPSQWFYEQRVFPFDKLNREALKQAQSQAVNLKSSSKFSGQWLPAGPTNIGGRLTDVEIDPIDDSKIFLGTASGGIFKSTDNGNSYLPIFDESLSLSVGDIAIALNNPEIIYVGTGEANPGGGSLAYDGNGMYKSINGGASWENIGLNEIGSVGRVLVSPNNEEVAYVAAMGYLFENNSERGVYKTEDGGQTWDKKLYFNDSTGAVDLAIHPQNPDTIYAAMWQRVRRLESYMYGGESCGIHRSYDGGETWVELENGLPSGSDVGRIGIGVSESNPNILYAIYADRTGYFLGLYKSDDGGENWIQTNDNSLSDMYSSYGWWFGRLKIDPIDPQIVYAIGFDLYKTINGGDSWVEISSSIHVDHHEVAISPSNSNEIFLANDAGLYTSTDAGNSWSHQKGLPIAQFYTCAIDESYPERLYGGAQDNGTNRTLSGNPDAWARIYGGDGFRCLVDPNDNHFVYAAYQYGNFARSINYGINFYSATNGISSADRKNWNTPVEMNPINSNSLYFGANKLYKSTNKAVYWQAISDDLTNGASSGNQTFGTITSISVSKPDTNIVYVGTDDANVWITQNNGDSWTKISDDLPKRWISRVVADPVDTQVAYVCLSGLRENEYMPHIFKTVDNGQTWEDVSQGLPEAPVNDLIIDPDNTERLIVANDFGVYFKDDINSSWQALGDGLPLVPVTDLVFHEATNKLVAATYGRSMYTLELSIGLIEMSNDFSPNMTVYPNPSSGQFNIELENIKGDFNLEIYNISGQLIYSNVYSTNEINIDLKKQSIKSGIYLLKIIKEGETRTSKLILK